MPKHALIAVVAAVTVAVLFIADPAVAAPGGKIARAVFESFWGKVALALLVIVFLPLIVLSMLKERRMVRRARADLATLAQASPAFRWVDLRERALACFQRVHAAWRAEDTAEAADVMTDWYWRNQQLVVLDEWAAQGLVNHCTVKEVTSVTPLVVMPRTDTQAFEGSKVVLSISAEMQDYLARRDGGDIVEGSEKFKQVTHLWTLELDGGRWKVSNIDESAMLDDYLEMARSQPRAAEVLSGRAG